MSDKCLICGEEFKKGDKVAEDMWEVREIPDEIGLPIKVLLHSKHRNENLEQYKPKMGEWTRRYLFGKNP